LGVRSYFLVVYYENNKRIGGGLITVIRNRVGDVFIVLGVVI
jgi:formate hydrogenlyase subunit 3/multisubunit Na+/H+ antiporter MnhD subunit